MMDQDSTGKRTLIMDTLVNLSWRLYLILPLMAMGGALAVCGTRQGASGLRCAVHGDAAQLLAFIKGFRTTIWGLALMGIGVAWLWHLTWLFIVSVAIGCGETLETFLIVFALRHGSHLSIGTRGTRRTRAV
jgi:hypothetical protein